MIDKQFDKETFKKSVKDNVKFLYRRKLEEATQEQLFQNGGVCTLTIVVFKIQHRTLLIPKMNVTIRLFYSGKTRLSNGQQCARNARRQRFFAVSLMRDMV